MRLMPGCAAKWPPTLLSKLPDRALTSLKDPTRGRPNPMVCLAGSGMGMGCMLGWGRCACSVLGRAPAL